MSMLVILLPARSSAAEAAAAPAEWAYAFSADGVTAQSSGHAPAAQLPRADTVVALLPPTRLSWQRPVLPKAPANRLRAALGGMLEEQLLDDDDALHLALQPRPPAGQPAWVAVVSRPWLTAQLAALQAAGLTVDRAVPALAPTLGGNATPPQLHFFRAEGDADGICWLAASDADGATCLPLAGTLARQRLADHQGALRGHGQSFAIVQEAAEVR